MNTKSPSASSSKADYVLKLAIMFSLAGMLFALSFFLNMSGGTLFLFTSLGAMCIIAGVVLFTLALIYDFKSQHALFKEESFSANSIVFHEGDPGDKMYLIRNGVVEVFIYANGEEKVIRQLKKGDYFGEIALLSEGKRTASIRAVTDLQVATVGRSNFQSLVSNLPFLGRAFVETSKKRQVGIPKELDVRR